MEQDAMSKKMTPDLGLWRDPEELHYEMLEDLDHHPRLATFQKKRLAEEQKILAAAAVGSQRAGGGEL